MWALIGHFYFTSKFFPEDPVTGNRVYTPPNVVKADVREKREALFASFTKPPAKAHPFDA